MVYIHIIKPIHYPILFINDRLLNGITGKVIEDFPTLRLYGTAIYLSEN